MSTVVWDEDAVRDLEKIAAYISQESPRSAARVVAYIKNAVRSLEASPRLGRTTKRPDVHEFVLSRYRYVLVYKVVGDEVRILGVSHHRQKRR